jgi:RNA polymerase sigma-70 factor, ECF subfamily
MEEQDRETRFSELFRDHYRQLFGYVYTLVRNYTEAEDVVQQTSLILWEKFGEYREGTSFVNWSCRIARFTAMNYLKQQRRYRAHFSEVVQLKLAAAMASIAADEVDQRAAALEDCVKKLPEHQRELLRICFGGTKTVAEIAGEIGRTTHSIYSSLRNIRHKLLDCVDGSITEVPPK